MKRFLAMLMAAMLLCGGTMAEEQDWYLDTAMELSAQVGELVRDDNYQKMMTSQTFDCIQEIQDADFTTLKSAYRGNVSFMNVAMNLATRFVPEMKLSDAARECLEAQMPGMVLTLYMGMHSAEVVAASTMQSFGRTYPMPEDFEQCVYLLEMDGALVGVSFSKTGENTISVNAMPLFHDKDETIEDVISQMKLTSFEKVA